MHLRRGVVLLALGSALVVAALGSFTQAPAQESSTRADESGVTRAELEKKARRLLELTGASHMGEQVMDAMFEQFRQMPGLPDGFLDRVKELADPDELVEMVIPIYVRHLDAKTMDGAIAFFESPAGGAFAKAQPSIVEESMKAGQEWDAKLAREALEGL